MSSGKSFTEINKYLTTCCNYRGIKGPNVEQEVSLDRCPASSTLIANTTSMKYIFLCQSSLNVVKASTIDAKSITYPSTST